MPAKEDEGTMLLATEAGVSATQLSNKTECFSHI